jgi:hypothetical protein
VVDVEVDAVVAVAVSIVLTKAHQQKFLVNKIINSSNMNN